MSAGRAVIGSKNGGMAEMLGEEECGLLIDPDKPKTIVAALKKMIENPQLRYRFGQLAREKVLREYSWDRIGARTEEVYSTIIDHWPKA
ncbi:MAG: glycosyltransferase family 4 protein [Saprospirales bacterium]|nr:glycosyltransferase family 4 protein [Saprospirales bacterium]